MVLLQFFLFVYCVSGNTGAHYAVTEDQIDLLRFLIAEGIDLEIGNNEGNTPLHLACQKESREMILALLLGGSDPTKKNNNGERPGEKVTPIVTFIKQITSENKAFNALAPDQKRKLKDIFEAISSGSKTIDLDRTKVFNMFVEEVTVEDAEKDAKDFIASCAVCDKQNVLYYIIINSASNFLRSILMSGYLLFQSYGYVIRMPSKNS